MYRYRARCKNCGDIIESRHQHDYVSCTCMKEWDRKSHVLLKEFITGSETRTICGKEYTFNKYDYTAYYKDPRCIELQKNQRGFSLDGGKGVYIPETGERLGQRLLGNFNDVEWMEEDTVKDQIHGTD